MKKNEKFTNTHYDKFIAQIVTEYIWTDLELETFDYGDIHKTIIFNHIHEAIKKSLKKRNITP